MAAEHSNPCSTLPLSNENQQESSPSPSATSSTISAPHSVPSIQAKVQPTTSTSAAHLRQEPQPTSKPAAIDLAYNELLHTIEEAQQYHDRTERHQSHVQSHITALKEDTEMLQVFETADDELRTQAATAIIAAKRLWRVLERDLIDLQIQEAANQPKIDEQPVTASQKDTGLKLPPLTLPTFNGEVSQFRKYRNFFEENIMNNKNITDTGKWLRLRETLQGQPADLVSELPDSSETLQIAWKLLIKMYGGENRPVVELYNKIQNFPPATVNTTVLRITHTKLEGFLLSLEQLGHEADDNHFVRWTYLGKFPAEIMYHVDYTDETPLRELRLAIDKVITSRECTDQHSNQSNKRNETQRRTYANASSTNDAGKAIIGAKKPTTFPKALKCVFCDGEHWNDTCQKYVTISARKQRLTGKCFKCLRNTHIDMPCATDKRCFHCDSTEHNRALCPTKFGETSVTPAAPKVQLALITRPQEKQFAGRFLTFVATARSRRTKQPIQVRIIVDTAGGSTVITKEASNKLQLTKTEQVEQYSGLNGVIQGFGDILQEEIELLTQDQAVVHIRAAAVDAVIPEVPVPNVEEFRATFPQFQKIQIPETGEGQPIDILIGSDTIVDILQPEQITAVNQDTLLLPTKFGALIVGRKRQQQRQVCHATTLLFNSNPLQKLSDLDLVGLTGLTENEVDEEEKAIQQFYETLTFNDDRYAISWPWRVYPPELESNFGLAFGRLKSLYRRLQKTPKLLNEYHQIIVKQKEEGIIEEVEGIQSTSQILHYLPHHPILQPEKSTSVRPVCDASSKASKRQKCLNDNIRKGTKWLNDLIGTLLRFRKNKIVLVADIARAFHQVGINEPDRDAVRFLWLKNVNQPPTLENLKIYRFTRVAFGIIASPFLLHAVIHYHAKKFPKSNELKVLLRDLYADNLVTSVEASFDTKSFYEYAKTFFGTMSMNLTKWATNDNELRKFIPEHDQIPDLVQSILGIKWVVSDDLVAIKQPKVKFADDPTPRTVARDMALNFDPLGWASPVVLLSKIFFRQIWKEYKTWDAKVTTQEKEQWSAIVEELKKLPEIRMPRKYITIENANQIELHTFVDASATAYAIVVYMRATNESSAQTVMVASKARLTPTKTVSIPKLELIAILLGYKFTAFVRDSLQYEKEIKTFVWSDSQCAIAWMNQTKLLPPAMEKQINEAKKCNITEIKYVPSEKNYADIASRGGNLETLIQMKWWNGPPWLASSEEWPQDLKRNTEIIMAPFKTNLTIKTAVQSEKELQGVATLNIREFSSLTQLLVRTANCFKALVKFRKNNFLNLQSETDVRMALQWWIYWDQARVYALREEPEAGKPFNLQNLRVFRDENGLIRCQTRLKNSTLEMDTINPVLLVKNSTLTKLIVLDVHEKHMHVGTGDTLANVRKQFWLPHGRRQTYKMIKENCFRCRRLTAKAYPNPPPAPLPEFRVTRTERPFQNVGIDICGPFYTRNILGRGQPKLKRWVLLITCAVVRAVHVEVLVDMTTAEILIALRKCFARRGVPKIIVSDNAPQFHLLDRCFKDIWRELSRAEEISGYFRKNLIIWQFVPELSPWMGGMYERMIKSVKQALERTYGDRILIDRQFETTMFEIENIINARPLTYVDQDGESQILTPNHFLMATYAAIPIQIEINDEDELLKKLWKSSQTYLNTFWQHWAEHYLLLLRERNDQLKQQRSVAEKGPQKGDVVVMIDPTKKRSSWALAIVERLVHSADHQVRAAQIKTTNGSRLIRPIVALAPLNLTVDLPRVSDAQLNAQRDALILSLPEGAERQEEIVEQEGSETRMGTEGQEQTESGEEEESGT